MAIVVVLLLAFEGGVLLAIASTPPLRVGCTFSAVPGGGVEAGFAFSNGLTAQGVRASLLPGTSNATSDTTLLVFADPTFPTIFAAPKDTAGIGQRVGAYLSFLHTTYLIDFVDAAGLGAAMGAHPHAGLLVVGPGTLPSEVYSANSSWLRTWVASGGTLFWAGGPVGFSSYTQEPNGTYTPTGLGWTGQETFFGYPLVDPPRDGGNAPPVAEFASVPTPLSTALDLAYNATPYGANTTQVLAHGGVVLGPLAPGIGGAANATSLAYLPIGHGGVFYFGGAVFAPDRGYVPGASVALSEDIALLLDLHYRPSPGPSATATLELGSLSSGRLSVSVPPTSGGLIAFARAGVPGTAVVFWSTTAPPGGASAGYVPAVAAAVRGKQGG